MTCNRSWFEFFEGTTCGDQIYLGYERGYDIKGCGDIPVMLPSGDIRHIKNVMYVLEMKKNLISLSMITDPNLQIELFKTYCVIKDRNMEPIALGVHVGSLYRLNVKSMPHQALVSTRLTTENLWH